MVVWVEIEGARVQALVDSGADFSMWRRGAVPANLLVGADDWDAGPLVMAKDELMWPVGKVEGVVEFEEMKRRLNGIAIVDSSPFAVILGNDWLEAMDAMVGYRKGEKGILVGQEMFVAGKRGGRVTRKSVEEDEREGFSQEERAEAGAVTVESVQEGRDGETRIWMEQEEPATGVKEEAGEVERAEGKEEREAEAESESEVGTEAIRTLFVQAEGEELSRPMASVAVEDYKGYNINAGLKREQREALLTVLMEHQQCFSKEISETLKDSVVGFEHVIETGRHPPVRSLPRRLAPAEREIVRREVEEMLKAGVIEHSYSPWASPVVLVRKKDGEIRFCVDYRKVNDVTEKDVYPLPRIDVVLDQLNGARYFVKLDLYKWYWQVPVREEHVPKTAFSTPDGHYQFRRMPFGLCNAPAAFQRMMDQVLGPLKWKECLVFMDDLFFLCADV